MVFRRNSRSWRNLPSATSAARSALVAEKTRTSTRRVFEEPTRSNSPVSSVRSSLDCSPCEMLAISSRNSVPPSAISKRPTRSLLASVNAPFTWPNSSLSKTPSASPPVLTVTSGRVERSETECSVCATSPLPVPFSPVISTLASDGPTREITSSTGRIAADCAISCGKRSARSARFSASSRCPRRSARPSSICVFRIAESRALSQGFWMKSRAPRRIASTASSTLPHAVITITGSVVSSVWMRFSRSRPSCPVVVSRV